MKIRKLTRAGNPTLREASSLIEVNDIRSDNIQQLIRDIRYTNETKKYGVGLAAPQVGEKLALSVIGIKPTPNRPDREPFESVIINPTYEGVSRRTGMWEGCQSFGKGNNLLFGKALRYKKVRATWYDENAKFHREELDGFVAHVFQHETDHLNGILFVDRVRDTKTFMLADEYRKRIVKKKES
jgi:peptide deformylase